MKKTRILTECALMIALSTILSFLVIWEAPLGGSVTVLSMIPIMLISIRHGIGWGLGSGFVYSIIQLIQGLKNIAYVPTVAGVVGSVMLDYILPFTIIGIAGIFMKREFKNKKSEYLAILSGVVLALVLRFICHFAVGGIVWYEITKVGEWNEYVKTVGMWTYSFVYNITFFGPEAALVLIASPILPKLRSLKV
ncbi:MAG: energy-coupled thiamine transporter ThiT, partial [Clostridia bacterium]